MPIAMPPAFRNDNNSTAHPPSTSFSPSFAAATTATTEAFTFPNTYIQRSRPYLTAAQIDSLRPKESRDEARTIQARLNACGWIVQVAQVLQLSVSPPCRLSTPLANQRPVQYELWRQL
jgi:hypothetical protein